MKSTYLQLYILVSCLSSLNAFARRGDDDEVVATPVASTAPAPSPVVSTSTTSASTSGSTSTTSGNIFGNILNFFSVGVSIPYAYGYGFWERVTDNGSGNYYGEKINCDRRLDQDLDGYNACAIAYPAGATLNLHAQAAPGSSFKFYDVRYYGYIDDRTASYLYQNNMGAFPITEVMLENWSRECQWQADCSIGIRTTGTYRGVTLLVTRVEIIPVFVTNLIALRVYRKDERTVVHVKSLSCANPNGPRSFEFDVSGTWSNNLFWIPSECTFEAVHTNRGTLEGPLDSDPAPYRVETGSWGPQVEIREN